MIRRFAPKVSEEFVLRKLAYFVDVHLWPVAADSDPKRWLDNFTDAERPVAVHLLNAFTYFNRRITDHLFQAALHALSAEIIGAGGNSTEPNRWREFLDGVVVTYLQDERPNPSDSGFAFMRRARQVAMVPETRLVHPEQALDLMRQFEVPVLFVDDFVGSGQQTIRTWRRKFEVRGEHISFEDVARTTSSRVFYCPLIASDYGIRRIEISCFGLDVRPAHLLTAADSALGPQSEIWPRDLMGHAEQVIEEASNRAGIADWKGFHDLGYCLAFEHSIPDASLPIFWSGSDNWYPLFRRS
jgi:hypothetical protein